MDHTFVNDQDHFREAGLDPNGPIMLVNVFTPVPGRMNDFIAAQTDEYRRLMGTVEGWIGNRLGLSLDGDKAVNVAIFDSLLSYRKWRDSDAFVAHLDRIQPFVAESAPGIFRTVYSAGAIP